MKYFFTFLAMIFFFIQTNAQDSNLYGTWYLYELEADLAGVFWNAEEAESSIEPTLTINNDLSFEGFGVCNSFFGSYSYNSNNGTLLTMSFNSTDSTCGTPQENGFESNYFNYVSYDILYPTINVEEGYTELKLENLPGYIATYRNIGLSVYEENLFQLKIYPNPISDKLQILSDKDQSMLIKIIDIHGQVILAHKSKSKILNTSTLNSGIYFLEITIDNSVIVKRFIKE